MDISYGERLPFQSRFRKSGLQCVGPSQFQQKPLQRQIPTLKVKRTSTCILVLGAASRRKSKPRQWVVDSRPSNSPAFQRRLKPVQTEAAILVFAYLSAIY